MAEWVANVKDVFVNVMCGKSTDSPKSSITPVSLEGCGEEMQVLNLASELPGLSRTIISLDDSSDDSSFSSDLDDGPPYGLKRDKEQQEDSCSDSGYQSQGQVHYKGCMDMPVRTKAAQGVLFKGELYVGGGYVTESKLAGIIHKFEPVFQLWDHLPTCPLKQFGMSLFENNLVAVGGKEAGNLASNKIYTLDKDGQNWNACIPPMIFARVSPVVIGYDRFLIVAGGKKGSLDYNMEIYDHTSKRWTNAPPLPVKCYPTTSVVSGHSWYILNQDDGTIKCAGIRTLIQQATGISLTTDPSLQSENTELEPPSSIWLNLPSPPSKPIQITTIGGYLLAITCESNPVKVRSFLYNKGSWCYSNKLPNLCGSSSALPDDKGGLYLFGGEGGSELYSNKLYKLTLRNVNSSHLRTKPPTGISFCL